MKAKICIFLLLFLNSIGASASVTKPKTIAVKHKSSKASKIVKNVKIIVLGNAKKSMKNIALPIKSGDKFDKEQLTKITKGLESVYDDYYFDWAINDANNETVSINIYVADKMYVQKTSIRIQGKGTLDLKHELRLALNEVLKQIPFQNLYQNEEQMKDEIYRFLEDRAKELGYYDCKIKSLEFSVSLGERVGKIKTKIDSGKRYRIDEVLVDNDCNYVLMSDLYGIIKVYPGEIFDQNKANETVYCINDFFFKANLNQFSAFYTTRKTGDGKLTILFKVKAEPIVKIRSINIYENGGIRKSQIHKFLPFKEGDIVSLFALDRVKERLQKIFEMEKIDIESHSVNERMMDLNLYLKRSDNQIFETFKINIGPFNNFLKLSKKNVRGYPVSLDLYCYFDLWNYNNFFSVFPGYGRFYGKVLHDDFFKENIDLWYTRFGGQASVRYKIDEKRSFRGFIEVSKQIINPHFQRPEREYIRRLGTKLSGLGEDCVQLICAPVVMVGYGSYWLGKAVIAPLYLSSLTTNLHTRLGRGLDSVYDFLNNLTGLTGDENNARYDDKFSDQLITWSGRTGFSFSLPKTIFSFNWQTTRLDLVSKPNGDSDWRLNREVFTSLGLKKIDEEIDANRNNDAIFSKAFLNEGSILIHAGDSFKTRCGDIKFKINTKLGVEFKNGDEDTIKCDPFIKIDAKSSITKQSSRLKGKIKIGAGVILGDVSWLNNFQSHHIDPILDGLVGPFDTVSNYKVGGRRFASIALKGNCVLAKNRAMSLRMYGKLGCFSLHDSNLKLDTYNDSDRGNEFNPSAYGAIGLQLRTNKKLPFKIKLGLKTLLYSRINTLDEHPNGNDFFNYIKPIDFSISNF